MFGLTLTRGSKSAAAAAEAGAASLYLHCTDLGWRLRKAEAGRKPEERAEELVGTGQANEPRVEMAFRAAGDALRAREFMRARRLVVLTDDPRVVYADTRGEVFHTAARQSAGQLRAHGATLLNAKEVTFGFGPFGITTHGQKENGVAAFADTARVGGCLGRLDRMAGRLEALVPVADILVRRAAEIGDLPYAGLYVGGWSSHLVLASPRHAAVTVRVLPFGVMTLVDLLAAGNNVSPKDARRSLKDRDLMAEVADTAPLSAEDPRAITRSMTDRLVGDTVRAFLRDVEASFEYFEYQRMSGRPDRLELFGAYAEVMGLVDRLSRSVPAVPSAVPLFELFADMAAAGAPFLNLLENVGPALQIGKVKYSYMDRRLVPAAEAAAHNRASQPVARPAGTRPERGRRGRGARKPGGLAGLFTGRSGARGTEEAAAAAEKNRRQTLLLFGLLSALAIVMAWRQYEAMATRHRNDASKVIGALDENTRLHQAGAQPTAPQTPVSTDKVLWTEKFLNIGRALNEKMWLTDVYLATETRAAGTGSVLSKKLVIEGAVLPSTDGHVLEIARFIKELEDKDKFDFMNDFRELRFQGVALDQAESDPIVRFGLEAWYDETKRVQNRGQQAAAASPLGDTQNKVRDYNEELNRLVAPPR